ncbi:hypothetical protein ACFB49_22780 [Sphingomonas sp. DBB INV C78]|uniref:hypothetical protein n=1 Tax=Sphingomonas sp. DBB INV C78 TaxID=3349434 RepID=UPI0036D368C5
MSDAPEPPAAPRRLDMDAIQFLILFELGQAPAYLYVDIRSKDRSKRERALKVLMERVARRFEPFDVLHRSQPAGHGRG